MNPNQAPPTPSPNLDGCCVVLVRTQGPINLGMVARICTNIGITDLRICNPQCEIDVPEARMFSTHGKELLLSAPVYPDLASATADCGLVIGSSARFRDGELGAGLRPQEVPAYLRKRPAAKWALVFGNEADGLTAEELRCCQAWVHLDTFGPNASYNLAVAVAIATYVIAVEGVPAASDIPEAAPRSHIDHLHRFWMHTLERFHYFRRAEQDRYADQLRRFLGRQHLTRWDVQMLRGMLAQFHWFAFGDRGKHRDGDASDAPPQASEAIPPLPPHPERTSP